MNRSRWKKSAADVAGPLGIVKMSRRREDEVYEKREQEEKVWFFLSRDCRGPSNESLASRPLRRGWTLYGTVTQPRARTLQEMEQDTSDYCM